MRLSKYEHIQDTSCWWPLLHHLQLQKKSSCIWEILDLFIERAMLKFNNNFMLISHLRSGKRRDLTIG